ncbi:unnamed protein product [Merluccius merluccius]
MLQSSNFYSTWEEKMRDYELLGDSAFIGNALYCDNGALTAVEQWVAAFTPIGGVQRNLAMAAKDPSALKVPLKAFMDFNRVERCNDIQGKIPSNGRQRDVGEACP